MKVILLQDVEKLGKTGEIKEVSQGYGFNFLLPKGLAKLATPEAIKQLEALMAKRRQELETARENFKKLATELKGKRAVIKVKSAKGKLFGSVGREEIAAALENLGFKLDAGMIEVEKPFKETGEFPVKINFGQDIKTSIEVVIEEETI